MTAKTHSAPLRWLLTRGGMLLVTGLALYLLAPSLLEVFSSWNEVSELDPGWVLGVGVAEALAWSFVWALQRLILGTGRWFPVVTSQLAGNAAARLLPGGGATGLAVQYQMLRGAGVEATGLGVGLAAVGILQLATTSALPIVVLPALVANPPVEPRLVSLAQSAVAFFVVLSVVAVVVSATERPLGWLGRLIDRTRRLVDRSPPDQPTAARLIARRDSLQAEFEQNWPRATGLSVGRATLDYTSLILAIAAFDVSARPSLVLLAYAGASLLGLIPITPGGLGFVEAGLTGLLVLAGVPAVEAASATFLYRLFSFWLPIPIGLVAGAVHRARYGAG